jgi:broad specificity phosphatase PhoE
MDVGPWGGTPWEDFARAHPQLVVENDADLPMDWGYPGGETLAQTRERGARALGGLVALAAQDDRPVIAISHGTLLNQALSGLLGLAPSPHTQFSWRNAAIAELLIEAGHPPKLVRLNDVKHLDGLAED